MDAKLKSVFAMFRSPLLVTLCVIGVVWCAWLALVGPSHAVATVAAEWEAALTMVFGSFIAGASSEGGGAVGFPVLTKVLAVPPAEAKLFSLMIQSVGMTAAAITIFAMRVRIDLAAIGLASLSGAVGVAISLLVIAPQADPQTVRVIFTALQASFACVLLLATSKFDGRAARARLIGWRGPGAILAVGLVGGVMSGLVGSGLDLMVFAVLVLLFRVSEKVATPTSVVIMAINSLVGVSCYWGYYRDLPSGPQNMWLAAAPVVVVGAPVGAWVCSRLRRETIAKALVGLISIEVATTFLLIPLTPNLIAAGLGVFLPCVAVCVLMARGRAFDPVRLRGERIEAADGR